MHSENGPLRTRANGASTRRSADCSGISLGIDVGTSGVRVAALEADGCPIGGHAVAFVGVGADPRDPTLWWECVCRALDGTLADVERERVASIAVDGTSGTLLAIDADGTPRGRTWMYDDAVTEDALLARLAEALPAGSAAGGATSGLAKAIMLARDGARRVVHQADWIAGQLDGQFTTSDANNALKTGFDPLAHRWPDEIDVLDIDRTILPDVLAPGEVRSTLLPDIARRFSLPAATRVVAGTTDGCASFLATGASEPGEGVTALGSTLVVKMLCDRPIAAPQYGLYSHRIGDVWLAGGASNSGGKVLAAHFDGASLAGLSARIDPLQPSGLDFYPLLAPGERFPVRDPTLEPRLTPRPDDDARFLHGMLEGMARIEAQGYARLAELGAPPLRSVRTVGGGAANPTWTRLRERLVGVPCLAADATEAAVGVARLALRGVSRIEPA